ncbi:iron uptake transporter permease EfeU [Acidimangrovimonas sediminis]|uniref:iron uptake transporter permease EfeU n=1 Tax=Acidimangrovimonas sediminis TaxID=2056283 RepID=UPI000C7FCFBB|nr:iron uptake transporter permease EfeU [Acidimangrovimonas sediminis]
MLATLVIGLREGLEAALIVGIIAAFLRRNGRDLTAMWIGVALAVLLSVVVGVTLELVERALPQSDQEAMETVIGAVAIFFVTGMIAWMNTHARDMKRELEAEAAAALGRRGASALALMAFLAVLKEGFETSVFLLATFSAAQSAALAAAGAVIGILMAVLIGWGIYLGGVKLNLGKFFRVTGGFLILVAAGLVVTCLRTAHEAGWLNAGQQATVNLSWLVAPGTVRSALLTGVLGIPADPRLIEVLGWCAYLIPVALWIYWPQHSRPSARGAARLKLGLAAGLGVAALALAMLFPAPRVRLPAAVPVQSAGKDAGNISLAQGQTEGDARLRLPGGTGSTRLPATSARSRDYSGIPAVLWQVKGQRTLTDKPATLTLDQVMALSGGRIPIGLNPAENPGPFDAHWTETRRLTVWEAGGHLLDAQSRSRVILALSGSGLASPRILRPRAAAASDWKVDPAYVSAAEDALHATRRAAQERHFWAGVLPVLMALFALILATLGLRALLRLHSGTGTGSGSGPSRGTGAEGRGYRHAT